jgi:prepilin-type N-terminal cleavage/methylation domain-containing protein
MNNKNGFSLIEIIIALLIGTSLVVAIYQLYIQAQKAVVTINTVIDIDMPLLPLYNQLEKDLLGVFVPRVINAPDNKKADEKKLENVFVSSTKKPAVSFNFLTTGGLQKVDNKGVLIIEPFVRRVFYSLEQDSKQPELFVLWYNSTENLDTTSLSKPTSYEIAWGIKKFEISFKLYEPPTEQDQEPEKKLVTISEFNPKEVVEKYKTNIPAFVEITGIITNAQQTRELPFTFLFEVPAYTYPEPPKKEKATLRKALAERQAAAQVKPAAPVKPAQPPAGSTLKSALIGAKAQ